MKIEITNIAASQIVKAVEARGKGAGILLGIKKSGCNGLSYTFEFLDDFIAETQLCFENNLAKVYINKLDAPMLDGCIVDYVKAEFNEGFDIKNPNITERCGCGKSFYVGDEDGI